MLSKALLYLRTVRHLKPSMVFSHLRGQHRLPERAFAGEHQFRMPHIAIPELDLNPRYLARFDAKALLDDEFLLINERHKVDCDIWSVPKASHLWNFNLHYFEWGIALAARWRETSEKCYLERYKELVRSWMKSCPYAAGDAWHPYTISLRLVNWFVAADLFDGALLEDTAFFSAMRESAYRQYRHLLVNQETHLRANHWWENLKTLTIASAVFGEWDVHARVMRRLESQMEEQILPDGVHFERSPMYHKLVLEGMLRVYIVSAQLGFKLPDSFVPKAKSMLDAMASLERGMGKTPFFNDSADGIAKECGPLTEACSRLLCLRADDTATAFPDAGYYKLYDEDVAVMLDAGEPGPSYMLGHAHCDCLSFELSYRGEPVIVNSGTYAYQGNQRPYFRSTAAHNTCVVDGEEQLECWGEHRVGRVYRDARIVELGPSHAVAMMNMRSGARVQRTISLDQNACTVSDLVDNRGRRIRIEDSFHMVPSIGDVRFVSDGTVREKSGRCSKEFGLLCEGAVFEVAAEGAVTTRIELGWRDE